MFSARGAHGRPCERACTIREACTLVFHRGGKNGSNLGDFLNQGWSVEKVICHEMDQQSLYLDILLTSTYLSMKLEIYWQFVLGMLPPKKTGK